MSDSKAVKKHAKSRSPFGWDSRFRWWLRIEGERLRDSLRSGRLLANPRIGFAVVVAGWAAFLLVGLASDVGGTFDRFTSGVLNAALVSLVFGAFLYLGSNRRVARRFRSDVRANPRTLLATDRSPLAIEPSTSRRALYAEVAGELIDVKPVGPLSIVGEVGAGKTTALLGLAGFLAERGMTPIYVPLRGADDLDFLTLAQERFMESIDAYVATKADAERVWRWLCRSKRVVVLADDLDQVGPAMDPRDPEGYQVRRALALARRRGLALAVTSRPLDVGQSTLLSPITLDPLSDEAAAHDVLSSVPDADDAVRSCVIDLVREGELGDTPFYLQVVTALARIRSLPEPAPNRHIVRGRLLRAYEAALVARRLVIDEPLGANERARTVRALRRLAVSEIDAPALDIKTDRVIKTVTDADPLMVIDAAVRLGLLERGPGSVRFTHEIVQSFLASWLVGEDEQLRRVCLAARTPRPLNALLLSAAGTRDTTFARRACTHLLECAEARDDDWGLVLLKTAADIALTSPDSSIDEEIAAAAARYAPADHGEGGAATMRAGPLTKRAAVPRLAKLRTDRRWHLLWDFTNDEDYSVKWAAACELRDESVAASAYQALRDRFDRYLADARELHGRRAPETVDDWRDRPVFRLKMLGWVLPSLGTALDRGGEHALALEADAQWAEVAALARAPITRQKGLEASMSQGLKADALGLRSAPSGASSERLARARARVLDALAHGTFWYSRIQLVHALALLAGCDRSGEADARERLAEIGVSGVEHPFTAEAARLAARSIGTEAWAADVWDDEGIVVGGRHVLSDEAAQLVADITLVLNLNEQGTQEQRAEFGERDELPWCLSGSSDRWEIIGMRPCPEQCTFNLCPAHRPEAETAQRELSKAFCRQQRQIARHRAPFRRQAIKKAALGDFWDEMERRARS